MLTCGGFMKGSMLAKLEQLAVRQKEIDTILMQPDATSNQENYRRLMREHAEITPVVSLFELYCRAQQDHDTALDMLRDPEMKEFAQQEIELAQEKMAEVEDELQFLLLPKDPNDDKNIFLEIRAGTGGDESALFSADLLRMYTRFADNNGWQTEIVSSSSSELGGYREVIVRVVGKGAYSRLKFESGTHRVQRVPETETQGRIHTSACTVAIMAEADDIDIQINPADLRIDTYRASGAGGQHVNKTDSAVRITHLPTGIVVECQDDRSQHRNRAQALAILGSRIRDAQMREQKAKEDATRRRLVGSGDRSERIRTYNFPQGRVTDHRINLTLYRLESIMEGDLNELTGALATEHRAQLLAEMGENV